jgi:hypothetical protein
MVPEAFDGAAFAVLLNSAAVEVTTAAAKNFLLPINDSIKLITPLFEVVHPKSLVMHSELPK